MSEKYDQSSAERQEINENLVAEVKRLLRPLPLEVIGHIESQALCCRNGTVAMVKIDGSEVINPPKSG